MIKKLLSLIIQLLRPFFGAGQCLYQPTCTRFALEKLKTSSLLYAIYAIAWRLLCCNPLTSLFYWFKDK